MYYFEQKVALNILKISGNKNMHLAMQRSCGIIPRDIKTRANNDPIAFQ